MATHYCESAKLPELEAALVANKAVDIPQILNSFCPHDNSEFVLQKYLKQINNCFDAPTIEGILNNLQKDNSDWARDTIKVSSVKLTFSTSRINFKFVLHLQTLRKVSPTSLKITQRELALGSKLTLGQCLQMEYRLAVHHVEESDFHEGIFFDQIATVCGTSQINDFYRRSSAVNRQRQ